MNARQIARKLLEDAGKLVGRSKPVQPAAQSPRLAKAIAYVEALAKAARETRKFYEEVEVDTLPSDDLGDSVINDLIDANESAALGCAKKYAKKYGVKPELLAHAYTMNEIDTQEIAELFGVDEDALSDVAMGLELE